MRQEEWRSATKIRTKTPINTETRHCLIMALTRGESVMIRGILLRPMEDPNGSRFVYGETRLGLGYVAGETLDLHGCAAVVERADDQLAANRQLAQSCEDRYAPPY